MIIETLQKIARSNEHQILFNRAKEISTIKFFNNDSDLSRLQVLYLYFLELYSMLYNDLNAGEDFISEEVIQDDIRTEAYLLFRKTKKTKKEGSKNIDTISGEGSIIFKRKNK